MSRCVEAFKASETRENVSRCTGRKGDKKGPSRSPSPSGSSDQGFKRLALQVKRRHGFDVLLFAGLGAPDAGLLHAQDPIENNRNLSSAYEDSGYEDSGN